MIQIVLVAAVVKNGVISVIYSAPNALNNFPVLFYYPLCFQLSFDVINCACAKINSLNWPGLGYVGLGHLQTSLESDKVAKAL